MDTIVSTPTPMGPTGARKALEEHHLQFQGFIFEIIVFTEQEVNTSLHRLPSLSIKSQHQKYTKPHQ